MTRLEEAQLNFIEAKQDEGISYTRHSLNNDAVVLEHFGDRVAQLGREWRQSMRLLDCYDGSEPSCRAIVETICDALADMEVPGAAIIREAAMESLRGEQ